MYTMGSAGGEMLLAERGDDLGARCGLVAEDRAADRLARTARRSRAGSRRGTAGRARRGVMPIISQWPVVVSLPAERSTAQPCAVPGSARGAIPSIVGEQAEAERLERRRRRGRRRRGRCCPSVFDPSSPYSAASGAPPTPHESQTTTSTLGTDRRRPRVCGGRRSRPILPACSRCRASPTAGHRAVRWRSGHRSARRRRRCRRRSWRARDRRHAGWTARPTRPRSAGAFLGVVRAIGEPRIARR